MDKFLADLKAIVDEVYLDVDNPEDNVLTLYSGINGGYDRSDELQLFVGKDGSITLVQSAFSSGDGVYSRTTEKTWKLTLVEEV